MIFHGLRIYCKCATTSIADAAYDEFWMSVVQWFNGSMVEWMNKAQCRYLGQESSVIKV